MSYRLIRRSLLINKTPPENLCTCSICEMKSDRDRKFIWRGWMSIVILLIALGIMCLCAGCVSAYTVQEEIKAVIGEAEGETLEGKTAIACAIHNRGSLHGVYGLHAPRVIHHKYNHKTYSDAVEAVEMSDDQEYCQSLIGNATYWEGTRFPLPYWAKEMTVTSVIGNQKFFEDNI